VSWRGLVDLGEYLRVPKTPELTETTTKRHSYQAIYSAWGKVSAHSFLYSDRHPVNMNDMYVQLGGKKNWTLHKYAMYIIQPKPIQKSQICSVWASLCRGGVQFFLPPDCITMS